MQRYSFNVSFLVTFNVHFSGLSIIFKWFVDTCTTTTTTTAYCNRLSTWSLASHTYCKVKMEVNAVVDSVGMSFKKAFLNLYMYEYVYQTIVLNLTASYDLV